MHRLACLLIILLDVVASGLFAQEFRATILGVVTDSTGAVVPNASVTVANLETGVASQTATSTEGTYQAPLLIPGSYSVKVEGAGFKSVTRSPVELRVGDRTRIDVVLEVGSVTENITVAATTPLLDVASSNRGQVIQNRVVIDLPYNAHNPLTMIGLAQGVQSTGSQQYFRAFDNGAINMYSINGGRNGVNEYQLDGAPNNAILTNQTERLNVGFTPPVEAVREMKIMTSTYDAQYGRTGGGIITMEVKSGTNLFHGAASGYFRRPWLEANTFANNAARVQKAQRTVNQYGFVVDGPVRIPKLYNGRDRTFFMFAYEKYYEKLPQAVVGSVATELQRKGDFSKTLTASGAPFIIYDPVTTRPNPAYDPARAVSLSNLQYVRTPFAGNQVPQARFSPIAVNVLKDIPLPNQAGDSRSGLNNWFADAFTENDYPSYVARVDHNFTDRIKSYGRWYHALRDGTRTDYWAWNTPAARYVYGKYRMNGLVFDTVDTLTPTTVLDVRASFSRFYVSSTYFPQDLTALGFPASLVGQLQTPDLYPIFTFQNYLQASSSPWHLTPTDTYALQGSVLKIVGAHSIKAGAEVRLTRFGDVVRDNSAGVYNFDSTWTSSNPQVADATGGNAIASFLLGAISSGSANINAAPYISWLAPTFYVQDDWQVNRKLTVNLGLRWDYEAPATERYNRQNRGFDASAASPISVPGLNLKGGLLFTGVGGQARGAFVSDRNNWQPRIGLAYKLTATHPLVFRAGVGKYYLPTSDIGTLVGFSQTTTIQTSTSAFLPFNTLNNPYPSGLTQPSGASQGLATSLGSSLTFTDPSRVIPSVWQFSAGFQYELKPGLLAEASYVGSRSTDLQGSRSLNYLTAEQLALGTAQLNAQVSNPFYGVLPANTTLGAQKTLQRRQLLTQFPQYSGLTANLRNQGEQWYNSLQAKLERRFQKGYTLLASYTFSKTMQAISYLNAQDAAPARQLTTFDTPHRLVLSGLLEFPFGKGKPWLSQGPAAWIAGGWQVGASLVMQSGTPMPMPSGWMLLGDPALESGQSMSRWFNTSKELWVAQTPDTLRTAPFVISSVRGYVAPQVNANLIRDFRLGERRKLQFKLSAYNATNTPIFGFPNTSPTSPLFGQIQPTQTNLPRSLELGFRYAF